MIVDCTTKIKNGQMPVNQRSTPNVTHIARPGRTSFIIIVIIATDLLRYMYSRALLMTAKFSVPSTYNFSRQHLFILGLSRDVNRSQGIYLEVRIVIT